MHHRPFLALAAIGMLAAGSAVAQQPPPDPQAQQQQPPQAAQLPPDSDSLLDKTAVGQDGKKVGELKDVVVTPDGRIAAVVMERSGGFGGGGTNVAVPWDQLGMSGDQIQVKMNPDQLSQLPEYEMKD